MLPRRTAILFARVVMATSSEKRGSILPQCDAHTNTAGISLFLKGGGNDKSFGYNSGPDKHGHNPSDDLRPYNISWDFIFQGTHETTGT